VRFDLFTKAVDNTSYATFMTLLDTVVTQLDKYPKLGTSGAAELLVIDGPPSSTNPDARYPALAHLIPLLSPKATIVLDDVFRDEERKLADDILAALPGHTMRILAHEKGTAVISPRLGK
jgi:hypothetical protein